MRRAILLHAVLWSVLALFSISSGAAAPPERLPLWPDGAPGAQGTETKDCPALLVYLASAEQASGAAVVVCPGGGYGGLAISYEGHDIARWLNTFGVTGLVLDYRHRGKGYGHPAPLHDAQRAIRLTRANAAQWQVDPKRIGILGFSAGGHLASTAATHFDAGQAEAQDRVEQQSCRPDFAILCYPVIAFGQPFGNRGTQQNLLGKTPSSELVASLSSERQVTSETPPTFLWSTWEDHVVPAENSIVFFQALKRAKVPAELHVFARGRHGLGLAKGTPGTELWPDLCRAWLLNRGVLKKP